MVIRFKREKQVKKVGKESNKVNLFWSKDKGLSSEKVFKSCNVLVAPIAVYGKPSRGTFHLQRPISAHWCRRKT